MMDTEKSLTNWVWITPWGEKENKTPHIIYFRKGFTVKIIPQNCKIKITADSRYKLYINGKFLQEGPEKGNLESWFVDSADLAPYLVTGENVIAVEVLRYPVDMTRRNHSLYRTEMPCLYVEDIKADDDTSIVLETKSGWKCCLHEGIEFMGEPFRPAPLHILENVKGIELFGGWKLPGYDDSKWTCVVPYTVSDMNRKRPESPFNLVERTIPPQRHKERRFLQTVCVREGEISKNQWDSLLLEGNTVTIPAHTKQIIEIDAGELMTGYLELEFGGGKGSQITLHAAECYSYEVPSETDITQKRIWKKDRTDWVNGRLHGVSDYYQVAGYGNEAMKEDWEPYWFRTFRYIQLKVETDNVPLQIKRFSYRETGYPLDVKTRVVTSDESLDAIWDISERTLRRCMHETYVDCPFYEQLQYVMDTRSQILYTYAISADDRLARQTMDDFRYSQRADGMLNSCAPSVRNNVIPGFSVYYILMVHDHMMYFGDKELVRQHLPAIDGILNFFSRNLNELGLVGRVGGPHLRTKYWSYIDWTRQWDHTGGVPTACLQGTGAITMESLLYLLGLKSAADLANYVGRHCMAEEYLNRADALKTAILSNCMGQYVNEDGLSIHLLQDGPGIDEYSTHCQVFAILNDLVTADEGRKMLETAIGKYEKIAQCSVAMQFYLFRALEKVGWYEKTNDLWKLWREMIANHMTTCVENDTDVRSDCHAWASTILYELPSVSLGVRPAAPGYEKVKIQPQMGYLTACKGDVITPKGIVHVEWEKLDDGSCQISYKLPQDLELELPNSGVGGMKE